MSQNPGTVGTLNRWFMPVYSPKYGSNRFWPIPIYIYVYLYCSYTFPPDHKIYSVDQCIICTGICNIYIYTIHIHIRPYTCIYIYDYIWDCIVDSLMDTGNRTWLMWFRLCSPKQTFKASWTRSTSCKHARLANLEQTLSNQVTQKYLERSTWIRDANMLCGSLRHTHTLYKYTLYTWRYYHVLFLLICPTTHHPACNGKSTVHLCPLYTICNFLFCLGHEHNPTIVLVGSPTEALNAQYAHQ